MGVPNCRQGGQECSLQRMPRLASGDQVGLRAEGSGPSVPLPPHPGLLLSCLTPCPTRPSSSETGWVSSLPPSALIPDLQRGHLGSTSGRKCEWCFSGPSEDPSPSPMSLQAGGDGRKEQRGWPGSPSRPPCSFCFRRGCTGDA